MRSRGPIGERRTGESHDPPAASGDAPVVADVAVVSGPKGHRMRLADLARQLHGDLVRYLTIRTGSSDRAEELAQETYAKVLALDVPDAVSFLGGYVWTTARNLASNRARDLAAHARFHEQMQPAVEQHAPSPETQAYSQQLLELLQEAIDKLPKQFREAFLLHYIEQLSWKEVGKRLGIGERMAMMYGAGALQHCQKHIKNAETTRRVPK